MRVLKLDVGAGTIHQYEESWCYRHEDGFKRITIRSRIWEKPGDQNECQAYREFLEEKQRALLEHPPAPEDQVRDWIKQRNAQL